MTELDLGKPYRVIPREHDRGVSREYGRRYPGEHGRGDLWKI